MWIRKDIFAMKRDQGLRISFGQKLDHYLDKLLLFGLHSIYSNVLDQKAIQNLNFKKDFFMINIMIMKHLIGKKEVVYVVAVVPKE